MNHWWSLNAYYLPLLGRKVMTKLDSILKIRDITLPTKVHLVMDHGFSSGHVWMWELDYKESWALKNGCFWTVVLEKTLESPLDYKEIQPVHRKGNQSWIIIGRTDAEAETPILWPPDAKSWHWKRPWCWERLKAGERGDGRYGWMASRTQWAWVWVNSGSQWWTGRPGMLQSMGSQSVTTERLNWAEHARNYRVSLMQVLTASWGSGSTALCAEFSDGLPGPRLSTPGAETWQLCGSYCWPF